MALDFKTEHLFRTCSVATDLVTLLDFNSIGCGTMLCHVGQTRSGSVATHFIVRTSTAMSSSTGGYLVVSESFGQNEQPAGSIVEWTKKT